MLNIYRDYYNWFEARQYVGPGASGKATENVEMGLSLMRVPDSLDIVKVPKRRSTTQMMRTPAMRLGAADEREKAADPRRVLYRPWLFHGTLLWRKFETLQGPLLVKRPRRKTSSGTVYVPDRGMSHPQGGAFLMAMP